MYTYRYTGTYVGRIAPHAAPTCIWQTGHGNVLRRRSSFSAQAWWLPLKSTIGGGRAADKSTHMSYHRPLSGVDQAHESTVLQAYTSSLSVRASSSLLVANSKQCGARVWSATRYSQVYTKASWNKLKYRNIMIRYSQAMPTFVVHDQLLLGDVVGCVLCAFAQRTHQFVLHDKEVCTHRTARTAGYFWGLLDEH